MADPALDLPFVSVIMPVRNEADFVGQSLGAIASQDYPTDRIEVLVIDGMSEDGTRERVRAIADKHPAMTARLLDNPRGIAPCALNLGLREARGEVIVRVDGHCVIEKDYVRQGVEGLAEPGVGCVGGPIETIGTTTLSRSIAGAMSSPFGVGNSLFRTGTDRRRSVDTVPFPAFDRTTIQKAGLFDEELVRNQDDEYSFRLRRLGYEIHLLPEMRSRYYSRASLRSLWRQYFQYGLWKVRVLQKHPQQMRARHFVPGLFVLVLLMALMVSPWSLWPLLVVGGVYLFATAAASLVVARETGWRSLLVLPLVFATIHFGYGSGFLAGLVRFAGRWGDREGQVPPLEERVPSES